MNGYNSAFIRRRWYIPYGKVVCHQCAQNKPTQITEYAGPLRCGLCDKPKHPNSFLVYIISEKPPIRKEMPLMSNIMFTPPADQKILDGEKSMTARFWKRKPPKVGQLMTASTGYKKETRFAILRITGVHEWDGNMEEKDWNGDPLAPDAESATGLSKQEIAEREGFGDTPRDKDSRLTDWEAFIEAYYGINAQKFLDDGRLHYFIQFKVEGILGEQSLLNKPVKVQGPVPKPTMADIAHIPHEPKTRRADREAEHPICPDCGHRHGTER